jgi:hypothetical protein
VSGGAAFFRESGPFGFVCRVALCSVLLLPVHLGNGGLSAVLELGPEGHLDWTGDFQSDDLRRFDALVRKSGDIRTLTIHDSRGGNAGVMRSMANYVSRKAVAVEISGGGVSACTIIFLHSPKRSMALRLFKRTYLHFHGKYRISDGSLMQDGLDEELPTLAKNTRGRFPPELFLRAASVKNPQGGLYVFDVAWPMKTGTYHVAFCEGDEKRVPYDCEGLKDLTAVSLGLVDGP